VRADPEHACEPQQHQDQRDPEEAPPVPLALHDQPWDPGSSAGAGPSGPPRLPDRRRRSPPVPELEDFSGSRCELLRTACLLDLELHAAVSLGTAVPEGQSSTTRRGANPVRRSEGRNVMKADLRVRTEPRYPPHEDLQVTEFLEFAFRQSSCNQPVQT